MNRLNDLAGASEERLSPDAAAVAESVEEDFSSLIAIFDRQLSNGLDEEARSAAFQARAAAERGLELSRRLISVLRNSLPSA